MLAPIVAVILQGTVTVPSQAMRLDALLAEFSKASQQTMHVAASMANRIVLVAGPPESAEALRADLATATWGKWRRVGDEWFLDQDLEALRIRERERLAARIEEIKKTQAAEAAKAADPFTAESAKKLLSRLQALDKVRGSDRKAFYPQWEGVKDAMPSMVALRRIFAGLDPESLARQTEGTVVYSDRPTRLQKPLPKAATDAIRQLERDQTVWAGVNSNDESWKSSGPVFTADPRNYADPLGQGSLRLVLRCQSQGGRSLFITAWFVDKNLKLLQFGEMNVDFGSMEGANDLPPTAVPNEAPIMLSQEALAFRKALATGDARAFRKKILDPEKYEPMELLTGEALRATAEARKKTLVAWLPDGIAYIGRPFVEQARAKPEFTPSRVLFTCYNYGLIVTDANGRIILRPRDDASNSPRSSLAKVVRAVDQNGYIPLDDLADYAPGTVGNYMDPVLEMWANAVQPGSGAIANTNWATLRLWSIFARPERTALLNGGVIAWGKLTPTQKDAITHAIVNADRYEIRNIRGGGGSIALTQEPTEILANGFSVNADLRGNGETSDSVYVRSENPNYGRMAGAWELAQAIVAREKGGQKPQDGYGETVPESFIPGKQVMYGLQMMIGPNLMWSKTASIGQVDLRLTPKTMASLSPGFVAQFKQALETARKPGN